MWLHCWMLNVTKLATAECFYIQFKGMIFYIQINVIFFRIRPRIKMLYVKMIDSILSVCWCTLQERTIDIIIKWYFEIKDARMLLVNSVTVGFLIWKFSIQKDICQLIYLLIRIYVVDNFIKRLSTLFYKLCYIIFQFIWLLMCHQ